MSNNHYHYSRERALWLGVINQALVDLVCMRDKDGKGLHNWFFSSNDGFKTVCGLAGVEVDCVRKEAYKRLNGHVVKNSLSFRGRINFSKLRE